jgi:hypothetical protein
MFRIQSAQAALPPQVGIAADWSLTISVRNIFLLLMVLLLSLKG